MSVDASADARLGVDTLSRVVGPLAHLFTTILNQAARFGETALLQVSVAEPGDW
jgi:hypothetical protein